MSTPLQRSTSALDAMRKTIFDQASTQIALNPQLVTEIFTIRTPYEIELILTQLNIDIDLEINTPVRRYIIDYGGFNYGDNSAASPSGPAMAKLDNLPVTYFSPSVRATARGLTVDTDPYTAYMNQQEDSYDKVSNSATEINRPKLATSTLEAIQVFDTLYTAYLLDGGKLEYLSLIMSDARYGILGIVATDLGCKNWNAHDPRRLIAAIRSKISSSATAIVLPASKVFQQIMMPPSAAYSEEAFAEYRALINQALDMHDQTMIDIGIKMQIQLAINGLQPSHFAALAKERLTSDESDWQSFWQVTSALEEQFKQSDVITRAALASTTAQKKYTDEFRKLHPAAPAGAIVAAVPKVPIPGKLEWQDRKRPNNRQSLKVEAIMPQKPLVDKPCLNCGPMQGRRHLLADCKQSCFHTACRDKPVHLAAQCKMWLTVKSPKKAAKVLKFTDDDDDDDDDEYDYDAAEVRPNCSHHRAHHAKQKPLPSIAGRSVKAIYDAGSNVFIGPYVPPVLCEAPIMPSHERVQVADKSFSNISGITTIGDTEFCIAPAFSDILVPQKFVEQQACSTVLANRSLYIINPIGTKKLEPLLANSQYLACPIDAASSGLYELSINDICNR